MQKIKSIFSEIGARFKSTSPYLFRVIQRLSVGLATLAGAILAMKATGITIPEPFASIGDKVILISAGLVFIVAKLPVDTEKASAETLKKIKNNEPE